MPFPNTDWPGSLDSTEDRTDYVDTVWAGDFDYQDEQIRRIQAWIGSTGQMLGEGIAGAGPAGALSPVADGGTAFQIAARNDFTSGKLLSVGDDFDSSYVEKFNVEFDGTVGLAPQDPLPSAGTQGRVAYKSGTGEGLYLDNGSAWNQAGGADADAIHDNVAGEIAAITAKGTPTTSDYLVIEDAADSNNKKSITLGDLPGGSGTDADAIHDNVAGEIAAVTEKGTPVSGDLILIEDSADSNNKKRVQVGNLPAGSGTDNDAIHDNVAGEISSISNKNTPVLFDRLLIEDAQDGENKKMIYASTLMGDADAIHDNVSGEIAAVTLKAAPTTSDILLIEDAAATNSKKRITIGTLPSSGGGTDVRGPNIVIGNSVVGDTSDVCDALDVGDGAILKSTIEGASAGDYIFVRRGLYGLNSGTITVPSYVRVEGASGRYHALDEGTRLTTPRGTDGRAFILGSYSSLSGFYFSALNPLSTQTEVGAIVRSSFGCSLSGLYFYFTGTWSVADTAITSAIEAVGSTTITDCWLRDVPHGDGIAEMDGIKAGVGAIVTLDRVRVDYGFNSINVDRGGVYGRNIDLRLYTSTGIKLAGNSTLGEIRISDSTLYGRVLTGELNTGIEATATSTMTSPSSLRNVRIYNDDGLDSSIGYGISLSDCENWNIQGCWVDDYGKDAGHPAAIRLDANCSSNIVAMNRLYGNPLVDLGTGNETAHNI